MDKYRIATKYHRDVWDISLCVDIQDKRIIWYRWTDGVPRYGKDQNKKATSLWIFVR